MGMKIPNPYSTFLALGFFNGNKDPPFMTSSAPQQPSGEAFDYVVVGGGTAGLVVASRLSEDPSVRVLVIEAGPDHSADPLILTPGLVSAVYGKEDYDWNFSSVPQPKLNNRCVNQARGKMLGGSSALNFLMMLYPSRGIIDAWSSLGNSGWDFDSLAPYFRKFATVHTPPQSARDLVGLTYDESIAAGEGPIQVSFSEGYGDLNKAWLSTFSDLGLEVSTDPRNGDALGAFQQAATIDPVTKTRSYAATGYYSPAIAARPNLVVMTETVVSRILFDTTRDTEDATATGVEVVTKGGQRKQISAKMEVILAAGALQSPQILELSGIGGKVLLNSLNIPVIVENPNVGENMQDHPIVCQSFEVNEGVPSADVLRDPNVVQALVSMYQAGGAGPLGQSNITVAYSPVVDGSGIASSEFKKELFTAHDASLDTASKKATSSLLQSPTEPAYQYLLFPSQITIPDRPTSMAEHLVPSRPENYITVMTVLNHPFSRGSVHISSSNVDALPVWDPKYNDNDLDFELLARAVEFVERIIAPTSAFGRLLKPNGKRVPEIVADDLDKAKEIVRQHQISVFHVSGSCAMLPRESGGVVDSRLRVYGTKGLRVVDASVFPLEPSGNIQSTVYAVAEKAADLIIQDRRVAQNLL